MEQCAPGREQEHIPVSGERRRPVQLRSDLRTSDAEILRRAAPAQDRAELPGLHRGRAAAQVPGLHRGTPAKRDRRDSSNIHHARVHRRPDTDQRLNRRADARLHTTHGLSRSDCA